MKKHHNSKGLNTEFPNIILAVAILLCITLLFGFDRQYTPSGKVITDSFTASVSIKSQSEVIVYESNGTGPGDDFTFHIGPMTADDSWYSYNGTNGGISKGYDIGVGSDGIAETFTMKNLGTQTVDVTVASSDFDTGVKNDGNYIDVDMSNGSFQIYIPNAGWRNVPDNNDFDEDRTKEVEELCVADNLMISDSIDGFDFRIRALAALIHGNYTGKIVFTSYDSIKLNPCNSTGEYIIP